MALKAALNEGQKKFFVALELTSVHNMINFCCTRSIVFASGELFFCSRKLKPGQLLRCFKVFFSLGVPAKDSNEWTNHFS